MANGDPAPMLAVYRLYRLPGGIEVGGVKRPHIELVTVDRRITPPTAGPERSVQVSLHSAPQYSDAGHAYP